MKKNNVNDNDSGSNGKKDELTYQYDLEYISTTREGALARDLAEGLGDMKNIRYYFSVTLTYSERYLREVYRKVKETPEHRIKKSRGALFTYLVKKYEHFDTDD